MMTAQMVACCISSCWHYLFVLVHFSRKERFMSWIVV